MKKEGRYEASKSSEGIASKASFITRGFGESDWIIAAND